MMSSKIIRREGRIARLWILLYCACLGCTTESNDIEIRPSERTESQSLVFEMDLLSGDYLLPKDEKRDGLFNRRESGGFTYGTGRVMPELPTEKLTVSKEYAVRTANMWIREMFPSLAPGIEVYVENVDEYSNRSNTTGLGQKHNQVTMAMRYKEVPVIISDIDFSFCGQEVFYVHSYLRECDVVGRANLLFRTRDEAIERFAEYCTSIGRDHRKTIRPYDPSLVYQSIRSKRDDAMGGVLEPCWYDEYLRISVSAIDGLVYYGGH